MTFWNLSNLIFDNMRGLTFKSNAVPVSSVFCAYRCKIQILANLP